MPYIPHSETDIKAMLDKIGVKSVSELFVQIPEDLLLKENLNLPPKLTPHELERHIDDISKMNKLPEAGMNFLGAGLYNHHVPALVDEIAGRQEFYTAYTPYQPEISQGTLTAVFEYQTMISRLTGLPVANASLYDGATAIAEAAILSLRATRRNKIAVSTAISGIARKILKTYLGPLDTEIIEIPFKKDSGELDIDELKKVIKNEGKNLASVLVGSPNFFGVIEDIEAIKKEINDPKTLLVASVFEAMSLGLIKPPGALGADVVVGESASFGNYVNFGGPTIGFITVTDKLLRNLPGRLCGETVDKDGTTGYVFTLSTREQHIRREKATSNICSNQNLLAVRAAIYLSSIGESGIKYIASKCNARAAYAKEGLSKIDGVKITFTGHVFNEFVISVKDAKGLLKKLEAKGISGGYALSKQYPEYSNEILICFTELNSKEDVDRLIAEIKQSL
jgi:glycine dehydrogenase subunit 1